MSDQLQPLSTLSKNLQPGIYQHYKGGFYKVFFVARYSEDPSKEFVIYQKIETGDMWIRPVEMFCEIIKTRDYEGPRFKYIEN